MLKMLKMLSGWATRAFGRGRPGWASADGDEINEAMEVLLRRSYGWHTKWGGGSGPLYHRRNGNLAFAKPGSFYPESSWNDAMKAAEEVVEGGMRVDLPLRKGRCGSRHLCVRLLTMCGAERPVPEIVCEACGETARRFKKDAMAEGWSGLYHSRPWPRQKRFQVNGWGYIGRCPSCGPRPPTSPR